MPCWPFDWGQFWRASRVHGCPEIAELIVMRPLRLEDGGVWGILAGQPTDDGELALTLARSLIQTGQYDTERAATAYVEWLKSKPFDVGNTTRQALTGAMPKFTSVRGLPGQRFKKQSG
ncbi:ADP-ribosylglycohydrolase family protein [Stutzerimonas stutzeri]